MKFPYFILYSLSFFCLLFSIFANPAYAIEDPLTKPNNKFGIHILFDTELKETAELVNASGGDWGYVTIPIQSHDKNLEKWQAFMDLAHEKHLIPLIRLSTEGDPFNTHVWRVPTEADIVDFANFLNSLEWPTKNRYIIVFNEVNRGDEWGGAANPTEYATLLSFAANVFKSTHEDFFVIGGGLDNAAPNQGTDYMNQYAFMRSMDEAVPGVFGQIDGWASHSYPNPAFSEPPTSRTTRSIASFQHERQLAESLGGKKLPIFITETGWSNEKLSDETRAAYYKTALDTIWQDEGIVAITPFLFHAGMGPFEKFSFILSDNKKTKQYEAFKAYPKVKGEPSVIPRKPRTVIVNQENYPTVTFPPLEEGTKERTRIKNVLEGSFTWIMGI